MEKVRGDPTSDFALIKRKTSSPNLNPSQNSLNFSMKNLTSSNARGLIVSTIERTKSPASQALPPTTKNVGVGTNLRHSSASVAVGHGHLGTINGPSSVSITAGKGLGPSLSPGGVGVGTISPTPTTTPPTTGHPHAHGENPIPHLNVQELVVVQQQQCSPSASSTSFSGGANVLKKPNSTRLSGRMGSSANSTSTSTSASISASTSSGEIGAPTASKIVSQNVNGTPLTGIPRTDSELQLFRVLQRANLLSYFDVMIELGGDDVQQLCEAGEEEFLEIMALIGMASKPLHVRRLQKALQEWMSNPALFQTPVLPPGVLPPGVPLGSRSSTASAPSTNLLTPSPPPTSTPVVQAHPHPTQQLTVSVPTTRTSPLPPQHIPQIQFPIRPIPFHHHHSSVVNSGSAAAAMAAAAAAAQQHAAAAAMFFDNNAKHKLHVSTASNGHHHNHNGSNGPLTVRSSHLSPTATSLSSQHLNHSFSNGYHHHAPRQTNNDLNDRHDKEVRIPVDQIIPSHFLEQRIRTGSEPNSPAASESPSESGSSHSPIPFLQENDMTKVAEMAKERAKTLPPYVFEPQVPSKRKFSGDFEKIIRLAPNDPQRLEEIRRMSIIYGRPDSNCGTNPNPNKRKFSKPLTLTEVRVNEAAAQLVKHVPSLLTFREELQLLAKEIVKVLWPPITSSNHTHSSYSSIGLNNNNLSYSNQNHGQKRGSSSGLEHTGGYLDLNGGGSNGSSCSSDICSPGAIKRIRMDGSGANGIEIQEYSRLSSNTSEISPDNQENAMQITPIRNLLRRSPDDHHIHSPLPLELVTVTATNSPHRRTSTHSGSTDLTNNRSSSSLSPNSVKIASIPVSGGCISISHDALPISRNASSPVKLLPIKTEPVN